MTDISSVTVIGLPSSGKTTFLAALWHMVREAGATTMLTFDTLSNGNYEHLNILAKRWRAGKIQRRTALSGMKTVTMQLKDSAAHKALISFPDIPGEDFSRMWEKRELDEQMIETLNAPAIALLVNGDTIQFPAWVLERMAIANGAGLRSEESELVAWRHELAPTQVQIVALLQFLMEDELFIGDRRIALMISAWDKVEGEELKPMEFLQAKLPLLFQYLRSGRDPWDWRVWGLSAQGGVYEDPDKDEHFQETENLRELARPSDRIRLVSEDSEVTDITAPLAWLIG